MSYDPDFRRDTPLALKLKDRIRRDGPIPVSAYMQACLYDPEHGYYVKQTAIGADGDFITAPEISQIFGELIGLWCAVVWQQMGSPEYINLIELGPGRGTLMSDALRATQRVPGFHGALHVQLFESNETLEAAQKARLVTTPVPAVWKRDLATLPLSLDHPSIVIGNEFLDTFPASQRLVVDGVSKDRGVGLDGEGRLVFVVLGAEDRTHDPVEGAVFEDQDFTFITQIRRGLRTYPAAMLFIDYGGTTPGPHETLQAVRAHRYEHPLTSPGEADLTLQVRFDTIAALACTADPGTPELAVDGPVTQAEFLGRLGIVERASRLMSANPERAGEIEMGVARLMAPNGMGTRFKAIGLRSTGLPILPGFAS